MLPGTLNCPSMIAPSDLCNYYLVLMSQCVLLTEIKVKPSPPYVAITHITERRACSTHAIVIIYEVMTLAISTILLPTNIYILTCL